MKDAARNHGNDVDDDDDEEVRKELKLDEVLLDLGCFDKSSKMEQLESICRYAVKPLDPTVAVAVECKPTDQTSDENDDELDESDSGNDDEEADDDETTRCHSIAAALETHADAETLFLQGFCNNSSSNNNNDEEYSPYIPRPHPPLSALFTSVMNEDCRTNGHNLVNVTRLCLSHSYISPQTILSLAACAPQLEVLVLFGCGNLPVNLPMLRNLKALALVDCHVTNCTLAGILQSNHATLERLTLIRSGNVMKPDSAPSVPSYQLTKFYYVNYAIRHSQLKSLVLQDTLLPNPDLSLALFNHPFLTKLSIRQTWLSDVFLMYLASLLEHSRTLEELTLKQVQWSPAGSICLARAIAVNRSLLRLDLSRTLWFGGDSNAALKCMLERNEVLQEVQMNRLEYSYAMQPVASILEAMSFNTTVRTLSLSGNHLGGLALQHLSTVFQSHESLECLDLSHCYLRGQYDMPVHEENAQQIVLPKDEEDDGWGHVLINLCSNTKLQSLSLEHVKLANAGTRALGKVLAHNDTLISLDLCQNEFGRCGLLALIHGLRVNESLQRLFLHGNARIHSSLSWLRPLMRDSNYTLRIVFCPEAPAIQEELQYYGSLNYAGRKQIYKEGNTLPLSLWPHVFSRCSDYPDMLQFLLQTKPDICQQASSSPLPVSVPSSNSNSSRKTTDLNKLNIDDVSPKTSTNPTVEETLSGKKRSFFEMDKN